MFVVNKIKNLKTSMLAKETGLPLPIPLLKAITVRKYIQMMSMYSHLCADPVRLCNLTLWMGYSVTSCSANRDNNCKWKSSLIYQTLQVASPIKLSFNLTANLFLLSWTATLNFFVLTSWKRFVKTLLLEKVMFNQVLCENRLS